MEAQKKLAQATRRDGGSGGGRGVGGVIKYRPEYLFNSDSTIIVG